MRTLSGAFTGRAAVTIGSIIRKRRLSGLFGGVVPGDCAGTLVPAAVLLGGHSLFLLEHIAEIVVVRETGKFGNPVVRKV